MPSFPETTLSLKHGHHDPDKQQQFEFESVGEVPESHAWPALHDHPTIAEPVPLVDLSSPEALEDLAAACQTWGAFQIVCHDVSSELLERLEVASRSLFVLPMDRKLRAARPANGVSGYGLARISCFFSKLMWSEGFTIAGPPLDHARKLWPEGDDDSSRFCDLVNEYMKEMKRLAEKLVRLMLLSLGLDDEEIKWADGTAEDTRELSSVLQLNSYPACPDPDRAMGLAAHTDSSLITILHQSNTSGLQLLRVGDQHGPTRWVTVPPLPAALIVIVGDLLQILTNGRFKSVVHRAVVNRDRHRLSAAYFCGPPGHVRLSPVEKLVAPGARPAYRGVTWAEYLGLKSKLFDKALAAITVPYS